MAKRQIRYYLPGQIKEMLPQLIGIKATVILQNGLVYYLYLHKIEKDELVAIDMKNIKHQLTQAQISEIIVEKEL